MCSERNFWLVSTVLEFLGTFPLDASRAHWSTCVATCGPCWVCSVHRVDLCYRSTVVILLTSCKRSVWYLRRDCPLRRETPYLFRHSMPSSSGCDHSSFSSWSTTIRQPHKFSQTSLTCPGRMPQKESPFVRYTRPGLTTRSVPSGFQSDASHEPAERAETLPHQLRSRQVRIRVFTLVTRGRFWAWRQNFHH